jgi:hypothetical protein
LTAPVCNFPSCEGFDPFAYSWKGVVIDSFSQVKRKTPDLKDCLLCTLTLVTSFPHLLVLEGKKEGLQG